MLPALGLFAIYCSALMCLFFSFRYCRHHSNSSSSSSSRCSSVSQSPPRRRRHSYSSSRSGSWSRSRSRSISPERRVQQSRRLYRSVIRTHDHLATCRHLVSQEQLAKFRLSSSDPHLCLDLVKVQKQMWIW